MCITNLRNVKHKVKTEAEHDLINKSYVRKGHMESSQSVYVKTMWNQKEDTTELDDETCKSLGLDSSSIYINMRNMGNPGPLGVRANLRGASFL